MAKKFYDLMSAKKVEGREKPIWTKHGVLCIDDETHKKWIKLETLFGEVWLNAYPQQEKSEQKPATQGREQAQTQGDEDVPF